MFPTEEDEGTKRREYLLEKTATQLRTTTQAVEKLKLIDTIQRLGIGYYLEEDIKATLQSQLELELSNTLSSEDNLFTTALRFRLLRHNGFQITSGTVNTWTQIQVQIQWSMSTTHDLQCRCILEIHGRKRKVQRLLGGGHSRVSELIRSIIHGSKRRKSIGGSHGIH